MSPSPCSTAAPMVAAALFNSAEPPPSLRSRPSRCCSRAAVDGAPPPHMAPLYIRTIRAGRVSCSGRSTTRRPRTAASPLAPGARRRVAAVLLLNGDPCRPPCVPFATWRPHLTDYKHKGQIWTISAKKYGLFFDFQHNSKIRYDCDLIIRQNS